MKLLCSRCGKYAGLVVALALLLSGPVAQAERAIVYRWLDESGVAHYTTQPGRIPREFRDTVREIGEAPATTTAPGTAIGISSTPPAVPPPVAAPPPAGPRVMPQGEFEEPPLGSHSSVPTPAPSTTGSAPASSRPREPDVAAPPPGFLHGTAGSTGASATTTPRGTPALAPASSPSEPPLAPADGPALDDHIAALEDLVGRDQSALQDILSQPRESDGPRVADRTDFREIAQRLPKLQADLKALRERRTRQGL